MTCSKLLLLLKLILHVFYHYSNSGICARPALGSITLVIVIRGEIIIKNNYNNFILIKILLTKVQDISGECGLKYS